MSSSGKSIFSVLAAGIWINISEYVRNELLFKSYWVEHYQSLGMTFPSEPLNGVVWMVWGFMFAGVIFTISRKFTLFQTVLLCWFAGFVLMWIVIWNMNVMPSGILRFAVPLSLLETLGAAYIINRISSAGSREK